MTRKATFPGLSVLLVALVAAAAWGAELPDSEINPVSGDIESVDTPFSDGFKVRHVIDTGQGGQRYATTLSDVSATSPRIAIQSSGDSWVVWWQDGTTGQVFSKSRNQSDGSWGVTKAIGLPAEDSRYPEIVHDGSTTWVAYQIDLNPGTQLAVASIIDHPEPWNTRVIAASSDATGDLDVQVHAELGHVWLTWVDESDDVGWTEYDPASETWGATQYEDYSASDIETARDNIRDTVTGP